MENNAYASPSENLAHLQRLYRITESDRRAYCQDTKVTLLRQRKIIHKLEAKREEVLSKLHEGDGSRVVQDDEPYVATVLDVYKQKKLELQLDRQMVQSQKTEIQSLQKELEKLLVTKGKFDLKQSRLDCITKKLGVLEDKLENASVHYNQVVYKSGTLRNTIEHLLKQRVSYRQIMKNLSKTLSGYKNQIEGLINKAILNYNLREEKYHKLQALKGEHALGGIVSKSQLQEAQRMHQLQKHLVEFIGTKSHGRTYGAEVSSHLGFSRGAERGASGAGQHDAETSNAELFTYTSSLNNKMESLQNELSKLKFESEDLERLKTQKVERNKVVVQELEVELELFKRHCSQSESELDQLRKTLSKLKSGVEGMLHLVVGDKVTPSNDDDLSKPSVTRAVKKIENEVNELLLTRQFLEDQQAKELEKLSSPTISNLAYGRTREFRSFRKMHRSVDIPLTPPNLNFQQEIDSFSESGPIFSRTHIQEMFTNSVASSPLANPTNDLLLRPRLQFITGELHF